MTFTSVLNLRDLFGICADPKPTENSPKLMFYRVSYSNQAHLNISSETSDKALSN